MSKRKRKRYSGVRQRGDCSYEINYYINKKRCVETVYARSEAEAFEMRMQRIVDRRAKAKGFNPTTSSDISLQQAIEYYLSNTEKTLKENTRQRSLCIYNHFVEFLSSFYPEIKFIDQITESVGRRYKEHLLTIPNKTPSGINTDITKLRAIFRKFCEYDFLMRNPFSKVEKIPKRLAKPKKKHLPSDVEIKAILKAVNNDPSYAEITQFLIRVGRRIEEASSYLKSDVIFDEQDVAVKIKVRAEITKTKEAGEIMLDDELASIIQKACLKNPHSLHLFTNKYKSKIAQNTYRDYLKSICKGLKIKNNITTHCFRYYVVNKLHNNGINFKDAMSITGHVDIESFMSYLTSTEDGRKKALSVTRLAGIQEKTSE